MAMKENVQTEVVLRHVEFDVCDLCLQRVGNECHTPGCAFWMNDVPDRALVSLLDRWAD